MAVYQYLIFVPGGNKTALVLGLDDFAEDAAHRKYVQDKILARHIDDPGGAVEQVGFLSRDPLAPALLMAGGEFCGNAMRSAAAYYLERGGQEVELSVSGAPKPLRAGRTPEGGIWAQMPISADLSAAVTPLGQSGLFWVELDGISHLVVPETQAAPYLRDIFAAEDQEAKLRIALRFLDQTIAAHALSIDHAYGVVLLEATATGRKMHPFVHVVTADTTYYETGCGSGAMCVALVEASLQNKVVSVPLIQPSGKLISAEVAFENGTLYGSIAGPVEREPELFEI